jgi:hypothetical protein
LYFLEIFPFDQLQMLFVSHPRREQPDTEAVQGIAPPRFGYLLVASVQLVSVGIAVRSHACAIRMNHCGTVARAHPCDGLL